ncbi:MAG: hypothetical protein HQ546_07130 [Planctomycetes bacterium]|nr:hypothetical protein [Planctomycetota bacterium]
MTRKLRNGCPGGCPTCPDSDTSEGVNGWASAHAKAGGKLFGAKLLAIAACAFVTPLAAALAGAVLAGPGETRRFVGLVVGLLAGLAGGAAVAFMIRRRPVDKEHA